MQSPFSQTFYHLHNAGGLHSYNFPMAYPQGTLDVPDLISSPSSPESSSQISIASPPTQYATTIGGSPIPSPANEETVRVRRPKNAFITFRSQFSAMVKHLKIPQNIVSKYAGIIWNCMPQDKKQSFMAQSEEERYEHHVKHPDYKYQPKGGKRKAAASTSKREKTPYARPTKRVASQKTTEPVPSFEQAGRMILSIPSVRRLVDDQWIANVQQEVVDPQFGVRPELTMISPIPPQAFGPAEESVANFSSYKLFDPSQDTNAIASQFGNSFSGFGEPFISDAFINPDY